MGRLFLLLFLVHLGLAFAAIVDCFGDERKPERGSRFLWALFIVFGLFVGPIMWFTRGRPGRKFGTGWLLAGPEPQPEGRRPLAPDDDPEFLARLDSFRLDLPKPSPPTPPTADEPTDRETKADGAPDTPQTGTPQPGTPRGDRTEPPRNDAGPDERNPG